MNRIGLKRVAIQAYRNTGILEKLDTILNCSDMFWRMYFSTVDMLWCSDANLDL
jgi:hypothetical protein